MGAKTGMLIYADGDIPTALRKAREPNRAATTSFVEALHPGWRIERTRGSTLDEGTYPPEGITYAARFPGLDVICDHRMMIDRPSQLPERFIEAGRRRTLVLHAMHSVVDWFAFGVWRDGHLVRALSLAPDDGILENIGEPYPFEIPYWDGQHPVDSEYPLPFHPLDLGDQVLRKLFGFALEGLFDDVDVDAEAVELHGYVLTDPGAPPPPSSPAPEAEEEVAPLPPPRYFRYNPDGTMVEIHDLFRYVDELRREQGRA